MLWLLITAVAAAEMRLVHRHTCYGASENASADAIGCAESAAELFEHTLTPATLWCNGTTCLTRFGVPLAVHSIDCDERRCSVLVHCDARLSELTYACVLTFAGIVVLVVLLVRNNFARAHFADERKLL